MISRFTRAFFWSILVASVVSWAYVGYVSASATEAVLVERMTGGLDRQPIGPGETRFLPSRIFPGRVKLYRVNIGPRSLTHEFRAPLAQSFSLGLDDSFYVQITCRLNFRLLPQHLAVLFQRQAHADWSNLELYLTKRLNHFMTKKLQEFYTRDADIPLLTERYQSYLNGELLAELNQAFQEEGVNFTNVLVERIYVPDAGLYRAMVRDAEKILAGKAANIQKIANARANQKAEQIIDKAYFSRLEKIGILLARYPHLRNYLAIDRLSGNVEVVVMPSEQWFGPDARDLLRGKQSRRDKREPAPLPPERPGAGIRPQSQPRAIRGEFTDLTPP